MDYGTHTGHSRLRLLIVGLIFLTGLIAGICLYTSDAKGSGGGKAISPTSCGRSVAKAGVRNGDVLPTDCKESSGSLVCGSRTYSNITWNYDSETIIATVTAYSPMETCPDGRLDLCRTAVQRLPRDGRTIACPRRIPFGSRVQIGTIRGVWFQCEDRTSNRFDGRFDIFKESYAEAKAFGKQKVTVYVEYPRR